MRLFCLLLAAVSSLSSVVQAGDWQFYYDNMGLDWGEAAIPPPDFTGRNKCGDLENQSPINLYQPLGPYGMPYGFPLPAEADEHSKLYLDPVMGSRIIWYRKNLILILEQQVERAGITEGYYTSKLTKRMHEVPSHKLLATKFHFHVPTEHSVEGKRIDIELHINHVFEDPGDGVFKEGLIGIMFSQNDSSAALSYDQTRRIDSFFNSLQFDKVGMAEGGNFTLDYVFFADFMEVFDFEERFVYIGSKMKPPCETFVNWAVLRTVYPIDGRYIAYLREQFAMRKDELRATTNIRGLNPVNGHEVFFISAHRLRWLGLLPIWLAIAAAW